VKRDKIVHLELFSPVSEAYRSIRTDILNLMPTNGQPGGKTILVTSAEPRAGKTMTITNLAIAFAQQDYKVLLVDCDLRKPQIHQIFGSDNSKGIGDYLNNKLSFDELIQNTEIENLKVITSGKMIYNPAEALGGKRLEDFIREAKQRFNFIFLDSPPVISVTDSVVLADQADASIQVVRSGKSSVHAALRVKELLSRVKAKMLGVILNDLSASRGGYGYYYNYKYYHYYGKSKVRKASRRRTQIKK
jgi:capsular exopolysaccharide synthesis family protein